MPRPEGAMAGLLPAVRAAARLAERLPPGRLPAAVYLGIYAHRLLEPDAIEEVAARPAYADLEFVRWLTGPLSRPSALIPEGGRVAGRPWLFNGLMVRGPVHLPGTAAGAGSFGLYRSPGFVTRSSGGAPLSGAVSRLYLALRAGDARWFLNEAHAALASDIASFSMKTLAAPRSYGRSDAAVVYTRKTDLRRAARTLLGAMSEAGVRLRSLTPLGTRRISGGLAWADSPPDAPEGPLSFGQWVTGLLIEAAGRWGEAAASRQLELLCRERGRPPPIHRGRPGDGSPGEATALPRADRAGSDSTPPLAPMP